MSDLRAHLWRHERLRLLLWSLLAFGLVHLASARPLRLDLTADHRFSLSPVSLASVQGLERPLTATVWFTRDLPPPYHEHREVVLDTLAALAAASEGKLRVLQFDPTGDEALAARAEAAGIRPITFAAREWSRQEVRQVYLGVQFSYGQAGAVADGLVSLPRIEHDLVRALRQVSRPAEDLPQVAWVVGQGEPDPRSLSAEHPLARLRDELRRDLALRPLELGLEPVPEEVDALLVLGPSAPPSPEALGHLDAFLMRGGRAAFFLAGVQPDFQRGWLVEVAHGLGPLLEHYGVHVGTAPLLDRGANERMTVPVGAGSRRGLVAVDHPLAPVATDLDRQLLPLRPLQRLVLPFAVEVRPSERAPSTVEVRPWVRTRAEARAVPNLRDLDPRVLAQPLGGERPGPFSAVVGVEGELPSFFPDRGVARSAPTRLVVAGSADLVASQPDFARSVVDWLVDDPALVLIRSRGVEELRFTAPSAERALGMKLAMVGLPLALLGLVGASIAWRGRER